MRPWYSACAIMTSKFSKVSLTNEFMIDMAWPMIPLFGCTWLWSFEKYLNLGLHCTKACSLSRNNSVRMSIAKVVIADVSRWIYWVFVYKTGPVINYRWKMTVMGGATMTFKKFSQNECHEPRMPNFLCSCVWHDNFLNNMVEREFMSWFCPTVKHRLFSARSPLRSQILWLNCKNSDWIAKIL